MLMFYYYLLVWKTKFKNVRYAAENFLQVMPFGGIREHFLKKKIIKNTCYLSNNNCNSYNKHSSFSFCEFEDSLLNKKCKS